LRKLRRKVNNLIPSFTGKLARQYAFWFCFFAICRLVFLVYNKEEWIDLPLWEVVSSFGKSLYVDLSMAAYFMLLPLFFSGIITYTGLIWPKTLNRWYTYILIVLVSSICIAELPIYDEWGHKLTYKALWFLQHPLEVYQTASPVQFWGGLAGILILSFVGTGLFRIFTHSSTDISGLHPGWKLLHLLAWISFTLISMRGGFKPIPVQVSDAYYSRHNILNAASANSSFHLMSNVLQNLEAKKPYRFMTGQEAFQIVEALYEVEKDTTINFLNQQRPNVMLIVLEGWASDVIASMGGYEGVAPHFSRMASEGISFDSCYASGNLSDQGMGAIFSAFPAQPRTSIITLPNKYVHLPGINQTFLKAGYHTSFMFGGQLSYGNIRSYMYFNRFHRIIEENDFDAGVFRGRLGVHDGELFRRQLQELQKTPQPFFAAMFTLSTHGPFDFPGGKPLQWGNKERDYINAVHYADSCLNQFMVNARKEEWYRNTLFLFVSDHHHNTPRGYSYYHPEYRRIPLVFYGEVIKTEFKGFKDKQVASQLDIASTLLNQLNQPARQFSWSNNLFNPYSNRFAFYSFDEGFGWIKPEGRLVWFANNTLEAERYKDSTNRKNLLREGKAYLQRVTEEFWKY
jgi:phosphoglycerol transferase MdoB-like AlkP superfamily enzyme